MNLTKAGEILCFHVDTEGSANCSLLFDSLADLGGALGMCAPPLGKNVKWVELPSGCVVPGSWSGPLALKAKLICGGLLG